jgi:hypothetical protein
MVFVHNAEERPMLEKHGPVQQNTGWKPMLHWSSAVWSDVAKSPAGMSASNGNPRDGLK